jgi:high-affinity iron transporter
MFANFLIGLREGLEAALIVSILLAYIVRLGRRDLAASIWIGVGLAILFAAGTGAVLQATSSELPERNEVLFTGIMSLVAVGLVTWMILWMAQRARFLRSHLEGEVDRAVAGGGLTLAVIAFVAVIREGLETALFLWSGAASTGDGDVVSPLVGALLGLVAATGIGIALYRGAIELDLGRLLRWSGAALVVVAAGVFSYGIGEFTELGLLPGEHAIAFDVSGVIAPDGALAAVLRGFFNFRPETSWPVFLAWLAYLVPVMAVFIRRSRAGEPGRPA